MFIQHDMCIVDPILLNLLTIVLTLQILCESSQHCAVTVSFPFLYAILHKWMLLIILHLIPLTFINASTLHLLSTFFTKHLFKKSINSADLMSNFLNGDSFSITL